ncbi:hypothetical protein [Embleya sp. AB8]|uniref:hypothetical protein n=1 Tax=Embleya sp. AB8 TaxID=3156304 RepID=UPI003C74FCC0
MTGPSPSGAHAGFAVRKARGEHLYAIADGEVLPESGEPEVVGCVVEFGPVHRQPHRGRQRAERCLYGRVKETKIRTKFPESGIPPPGRGGSSAPSCWSTPKADRAWAHGCRDRPTDREACAFWK